MIEVGLLVLLIFVYKHTPVDRPGDFLFTVIPYLSRNWI